MLSAPAKEPKLWLFLDDGRKHEGGPGNNVCIWDSRESVAELTRGPGLAPLDQRGDAPEAARSVRGNSKPRPAALPLPMGPLWSARW